MVLPNLVSEIEMKIPIPKRQKRQYKYPFRDMKIGESFSVDVKNENDSKQIRLALAQAASFYGRTHGMKFTIRRRYKAFRCWRIA